MALGLTWTGGLTANTAQCFTELTGTLNFTNDDVRAVYIDWGDGQDPAGSFSNDKRYSNYQWIETTESTGSLVAKHTYTATGTFQPIVQTINSRGFASNYYGAGSSGPNPFNTRAEINEMAISDGQATGVLKVENKSVYSGIDNSLFEKEGPKDIKMVIAPFLSSGNLDVIKHVTLEITAEVDTTMLNATDSTTVVGAGKKVEVITKTLSGSSFSTASGLEAIDVTAGQVSRILKVVYKNPKLTIENNSGGINSGSTYDDYDKNYVFNFLKIFIVAQGNDTNYYPLTYVTAGSPIKTSDDPRRYLTMDFTQSRAKDSNVALKNYRFDVGKAWFNPAYQWNVTSGSSSSDEYLFFNNDTSGSQEVRNVAYTYGMVRPDGLNGSGTIGGAATPSVAFTDDSDAHWYVTDQKYREDQFVIDDFGRFTDQYHLTRMSAEPSGMTYPAATSAANDASSINNNKPYVFWMQPAYDWASERTICNIDNNTTPISKNYTEQAFRNGSATMVNVSGMNEADYEYNDGSTDRTNDPLQYFLILFPSKTNKVFLNLNNYANGLINANLSGTSFSTGWKVAGVSYLSLEKSGTKHQEAMWKSVPFEDTTKVSLSYKDTTNEKIVDQSNSLSQSGFLNFDMPLDWDTCSLKTLYGGVTPGVAYSVTGADDITLTGTCGTSADVTGYGYQNPVTISNPTAIENHLSDSEVGAFKYGFIINTGTGAQRFYWVASGASDGYKASSNILNLHFGDSTTATQPAGTITGSLRRINVYDIVDGFSKVFNGTSTSSLVPVGAGAAFANEFIFNSTGGSTVETDLFNAWGTTDLYALKVAVSGTATVADAFPEIWNVFDGNQVYEDVVTEIDDSAFCLNSLPIISDIGISRAGAYYQAITRKGKTIIARTGDVLSSLGFSSVALGDGNRLNADGTSRAFSDTWQTPTGYSFAGDNLYAHLHTVRKLQAESIPVYWDQQQKDGTFIRFWGVITNVGESFGVGGSQNVVGYDASMTITEIALIDANSNLMTDIFPLGGVEDAKDFA